jgi:hypothetical protein
MTVTIIRAVVSAIILVAVAEISKRQPRLGAILLTLPIVSIMAFTLSWWQYKDLPAVSRLARESLVLVPLTLPFFVPLAFADRLHLGFWAATGLGVVLAGSAVGCWIAFRPGS